jgi:hypothetical protein
VVQPSGPSSYGQAAKILDIAMKVYVYYCTQPTPGIGERIVLYLHGAIDTPIMKYLKKAKPDMCKIRATTIKALDKEAYQALQSVLLTESHEQNLHPVQYDDILEPVPYASRRPFDPTPPVAIGRLRMLAGSPTEHELNHAIASCAAKESFVTVHPSSSSRGAVWPAR